MAKKDENNSSDKEVYELWWEYLKRSELYKTFLDLIPKATKRENNQDFVDLNVMDELFRSKYPVDKDSFMANARISVSVAYMGQYFENFGDIFNNSFDDWWEKRSRANHSLPVIVLNDGEASKSFPQFAEMLEQKQKEKKKALSSQETLAALTESNPNYIFLAVPMVGGVTIEDISKQIVEIRSKWKEHFDIEDFNYRRFKMPVSRVRLDEMKRYLQLYDKVNNLKEAGLKMKDIIAEVSSESLGNATSLDSYDVIRRVFYSDLQKAKKIIRNVECGSFPEEPDF